MLYYSRRFFDADGFGVLPPSAVESCTNFLLQLSRVASDLTVLEVTFNGHIPPIGAALSSAVSTKTNITAFTSAEVPLLPKGFVQLSRCPCLHTAIVSLRADDWVTDGNTVSPQLDRDVCFPTLLTLTMSLNNFDLCVHPIQIIQSQELSDLTLEFAGHLDSDIPVCLATLPHRPFASCLRKLAIKLDAVIDPPSYTVRVGDLAPLFPLHLHHLMIYSHDIVANDNFVRKVSEAWPNIETLRLSTSKESAWQVSLPGLLPFICHCPLLSELCINADAATAASVSYSGNEAWSRVAEPCPAPLER